MFFAQIKSFRILACLLTSFGFWSVEYRFNPIQKRSDPCIHVGDLYRTTITGSKTDHTHLSPFVFKLQDQRTPTVPLKYQNQWLPSDNVILEIHAYTNLHKLQFETYGSVWWAKTEHSNHLFATVLSYCNAIMIQRLRKPDFKLTS